MAGGAAAAAAAARLMVPIECAYIALLLLLSTFNCRPGTELDIALLLVRLLLVLLLLCDIHSHIRNLLHRTMFSFEDICQARGNLPHCSMLLAPRVSVVRPSEQFVGCSTAPVQYKPSGHAVQLPVSSRYLPGLHAVIEKEGCKQSSSRTMKTEMGVCGAAYCRRCLPRLADNQAHKYGKLLLSNHRRPWSYSMSGN